MFKKGYKEESKLVQTLRCYTILAAMGFWAAVIVGYYFTIPARALIHHKIQKLLRVGGVK